MLPGEGRKLGWAEVTLLETHTFPIFCNLCRVGAPGQSPCSCNSLQVCKEGVSADPDGSAGTWEQSGQSQQPGNSSCLGSMNWELATSSRASVDWTGCKALEWGSGPGLGQRLRDTDLTFRSSGHCPRAVCILRSAEAGGRLAGLSPHPHMHTLILCAPP